MKNRALIIEFFGLPGSGKSTVHDSLIKEIKSQFNIFSLQDVYFYNQNREKGFYIFLKSIIYKGNFKLIFSLMKNFYKTMSRERLADCLRLIKFRYQLIKVIENESFDLLLLEEGIIQYMTSIAFTDELSQKTIQLLFHKCEISNSDYFYVNFEISELEALNRIRAREVLFPELGERRTDSLTDKSAINALSVTNLNMKSIVNSIDDSKILLIDSTISIKDKKNLLLQYINEKLLID